jgi:hypothetical protein
MGCGCNSSYSGEQGSSNSGLDIGVDGSILQKNCKESNMGEEKKPVNPFRKVGLKDLIFEENCACILLFLIALILAINTKSNE